MDKKELSKRQSKLGLSNRGNLSNHAKEAFEMYFATERGSSAVARKFGVSEAAVRKYAAKHGWHERYAHRRQIADNKTDEIIGVRVGKHNAQTVQLARALKTVVGGLIKQGHARKENGDLVITLDSKQARELSETLNNAAKLERLVLGESTDKQERSDVTWKDIITELTKGNGFQHEGN